MTPPATSSFGLLLRRHRQTASLSQETLAERAGLSTQAVGALERGDRRQPHPETVRRLADALDLSGEMRAAFIAAVPAMDANQPTAHADAATRATGMPAAGGTHHLPLQPTPLFGRDADIAAVTEYLRNGARLVTVTGPGGVGKTRLALAVAAMMAESQPYAAIFLALAPLADAALVVPTMAHAVGLREGGDAHLRDALYAHLREKGPLLLVLDNMEHLLAAASEVADVLAACPELAILVTSRAPLRLRGEQEYPVASLPVPAHQTTRATMAVVAPSVQLFAERARTAVPQFAVTEANAAAVAGICRQLDGLPLAIELAAAWIRLLPPAALLARLERALPLLADGPRDLPARQRTMRDALAWSYNLLEASERALFRCLAVFKGRFTIEAAEAVGAGAVAESGEILRWLSGLAEQSLVKVEHETEGTRYSMLEPIRQYALERLEEVGNADAALQRLAEYYLALLERAEPEMKGADQVLWLNRLEEEHDNLRIALSWFIGRGETVRASRLAYLLWLFWFHRGHFAEGRRWLQTILAQNPPPVARAWALLTLGSLHYGSADYAAAAIPTSESLAIFSAEREGLGIVLATGVAGLIAIGQGQLEHGLALLEEATSGCLREGDIFNASILAAYAAVVYMGRHDYARAGQVNEQALALARESGNTIGVYTSLYYLATLAHLQGDHRGAARQFREALILAHTVGDRGNTCYGLEGLATLAASAGDFEHATRLWGAAEALLEAGEPTRMAHAPDCSLSAAAMAEARATLGQEAFEEAWANGRALTFAQAVEHALAWNDQGR